MFYRRADLIDVISKTDGRPTDNAAQKVKAPALLACLKSTPREGRLLAEYSVSEIVRARLLIAAQDAAGLRYDDLPIINAKLNERLGHGEWFDNALADSTGLEAIIAAARSDVLATIEIQIGYDSDKRKVIRAGINLEDYRNPHRAWRALDGAEGVRVLAYTAIPASRLAREVLAEVAG